MKKIRLGLIGLGCRGMSILEAILLPMPDVEITAVCDIYEDRARKAASVTFAAGKGTPVCYSDYRRLIKEAVPDAVLIFTGWEKHTEIAICAMEAGIPVGSEVGCEYTLENCWDLIKTHERTSTPYMFLENCCYGREELLATSMVREGLLGTVVHCQGSYAHDLRHEIAYGIENRHYRYKNYEHYCMENYPTHELGPIARLLNINRGNRIVSVVSVASKASGMDQYIQDEAKKGPLPESLQRVSFQQGDIVTTILKCAGGETITLRLDTTLPRFYARDFTVRGTKGLYEQNTHTVFLDGVHEEKYYDALRSYRELIGNAADYEPKYLPKIWQEVTPEMEAAGHGGMDFFTYRAFLRAVKDHTRMPIDVYDGASWMAVSVLSAQSVASGGTPYMMPDFTHGSWHVRKPEDVNDYEEG